MHKNTLEGQPDLFETEVFEIFEKNFSRKAKVISQTTQAGEVMSSKGEKKLHKKKNNLFYTSKILHYAHIT